MTKELIKYILAKGFCVGRSCDDCKNILNAEFCPIGYENDHPNHGRELMAAVSSVIENLDGSPAAEITEDEFIHLLESV